LFELRQALEAYDFCQKQIGDCDGQLKKYLAALPDRAIAQPEQSVVNDHQDAKQNRGKKNQQKSRKSQKNQPKFDLEAEFTRICGVNLKTIDGVDVMTIATFLSELGTNMTPWRTEDHLVSWLKLAPCRQISGGKVIKHERLKTKNRVAEVLRMAASALIHSDSYLGARLRHMRSRLGPGKAIKAMAAHLARLIYRMLTHGRAWVDRGAQEHETKRVERETLALQRKAIALGFRLEPAA
jgi:transposase